MVINILESITSELASTVLRDIEANTDEEITVNIMSQGGDVTAGSAIIDALKLSPAIVTTKVFGVAASMAAAISQAGDVRLIAEDAIFQPHNAAALPNGRPTKENLSDAVDVLSMVDAILLKSFSKSNLSDAELEALLIEDKPLSANEAISMAFFDGSMEAVKAAAHLTKLVMNKEQTIASKLKALKDKFLPTAEEGVTAPVDAQDVTREEFDALVEMVTQLIEQIGKDTPEETPAPDAPPMEEAIKQAVEAKLDLILADIKSDTVIAEASATDLDTPPVEKEPATRMDLINARQEETKSKFKV